MTDPDVRPWGWFRALAVGPGYQVKLLHVHPGGRLSLQWHEHRSEHWVVVRGRPTVTVGNHVLQLAVGGTADIPAGTHHRLGNATDEPVEVIEVQRGNYLGEDDITRIADDYDRTTEV